MTAELRELREEVRQLSLQIKEIAPRAKQHSQPARQKSSSDLLFNQQCQMDVANELLEGCAVGARRRSSMVLRPHAKDKDANFVDHTRPTLLILDPHSFFLQMWNIFIIIGCLYTAITLVLRLGFAIESSQAATSMDIILECSFLLDIGINFRTGFMDSHHDVVAEPHAIAQRYLRSWLLVDALASVPVELLRVCFGVAPGSFMQFFRLCKTCRLFRLQSKGLSSIEQRLRLNPRMTRLWKIVGMFLLIIHFIACSYWAVARAEGVDFGISREYSIVE